MLYTNLKHLESIADHNKAISENENVMVIADAWAPCVYLFMVSLKSLKLNISM